jgi:hypothetical protein
MQKGDIDWNTANSGGKVAGNIIAGELMAPGKAGEFFTEGQALLKGEQVAAEAAAATTALAKTEEVANLAGKAEEATTAAAKTEEVAGAGTATEKFPAGEMPKSEPTPSTTPSEKAVTTIEQPPPDESPTVKGGLQNGGEGQATTKIEPAPGEGGATTKIEPGPQQAPTVKQGATVEKPAPNAGGGTRAPPNPDANKELSFTTADGKQVTVKTGDELGHGSSSTAYVDANDPNKVIRVTNTKSVNSPEAAKLDEFGRKAVESFEKPGGDIRVVKKGESFTVSDPNSPLNGKIVEVNERADSAKSILQKQPGGMTQGQAEAFDKGMRELNDNGYAWMDNHTGNYSFEKVPGGDDKWKMVVIDPGGIVPMEGATTLEKAQNARALQTSINVVDPAEANLVKTGGPDRIKMMNNLRKEQILEQFGDKIDTAAMGLNSPNEIAWYSYGTLDFSTISKLGSMEPEQAAAYYAGKK